MSITSISLTAVLASGTPKKSDPAVLKAKSFKLTRKWLEEHGLKWETVTWEDISEALYGDKKYADELKKKNLHVLSPTDVKNGDGIVDFLCSAPLIGNEIYCVPTIQTIEVKAEQTEPKEPKEKPPVKPEKKNGTKKNGKKNGNGHGKKVGVPTPPETPPQVEETPAEAELKLTKKKVVYSGKSAKVIFTFSKEISEEADVRVRPQKGSGIKLSGGEDISGKVISIDLDLSQMDPAPEGGWKVTVILDGKPMGSVKIKQD